MARKLCTRGCHSPAPPAGIEGVQGEPPLQIEQTPRNLSPTAQLQDPKSHPSPGLPRGAIPALPRVRDEGQPEPPYLCSPLDVEDELTFQRFGEMPLEISCQNLI